MVIKFTLSLTERGKESTTLGWERIDVLGWGFDTGGRLAEFLCVADGHLVTIGGEELHADLLMFYSLESEATADSA